MANLEQILYFLDETFKPATFPDYSYALNGLQVEGPQEVERIGAAVDASEETILEAVRTGVQLLLVHHGLFWGGLGPISGPRFRKVAALIRGGVGLYSLHLPLDVHPEMGNNAVLLKALGLEAEGPFGVYKDQEVGKWARCEMDRNDLVAKVSQAVEGEARLIPGGPRDVSRVGVLTGGGASFLHEAAAMGLDTLVTGEAPHHAYHDAMELGLNLVLGGHYGTETFGVKALAGHLAEKFDLSWEFLYFPTGL
jgi:dinuclear metal center YbgI/SA1388 family protein